jgi:thymidine kinase
MVSRDFEINSESKKGWIEVVCGSMFSGKTEELIRRINRAKIAKQKIEIFKPAIDKRYDDMQVVSHNANSLDSTPIEAASEILLLANNAEVIGIDEAQFFDEALPEVCTKLAQQGKRVIIAGLDMDFLGRPFGPMPHLLAIAEYVTKVHAICMQCGQLAYVSHRTSEEKQTVVVGEKDRYEPLCRSCFNQSII